MSKELYIACHEALIEEYLEENGLDDDHWDAAYEATADKAYDRMQDVLADRADAAWEAFSERRRAERAHTQSTRKEQPA